jgi:hypothetical protein
MMVITWVDLQGRYRVTSPAFNDSTRPPGETEIECLNRTWANLVAKGGYGIPLDYPHHYVEDADQRKKLIECSGTEFRYAGMPDANGDRSAERGAWEMDTDGTPRVNMEKARGVHMDAIRLVRNAELEKKDVPFMRAVESGDTEAQAAITEEKKILRDIPQTFDLTTRTPAQLSAKWPKELPPRTG